MRVLLAILGTPVIAQQKKYARGYVSDASEGINNAIEVTGVTDEMRSSAPGKLDWSEKGATSAIKDQGHCGSCWAYSAAEGVETAIWMGSGRLPPSLSTQQLISCDTTSHGCKGGSIGRAFKYIESDGGLDTNSDYPDTSHLSNTDGSCVSHQHKAMVSAYKSPIQQCYSGSCSNQDEDALKAALNTHGPMSICLNANNWEDYSGGIYTDSCPHAASDQDHCVQLVGYDTTVSTPYWKIRNSWGTRFGENGYIRLPFGHNACGLANEPYYVTASYSGSPSPPGPSPTPSPSPAPACRRRRCAPGPSPTPAPTPAPAPACRRRRCAPAPYYHYYSVASSEVDDLSVAV